MTRAELDGWLQQADRIERGRAPPVVIPWAVSPAPAASSGSDGKTFISKRKKK